MMSTACISAGTTGGDAARTWAPRRNRYRQLAALLLVLGLALRAVLYLQNHPLYMDEAALAMNLRVRDFAGLMQQLDELQVAPLLFLWLEHAALRTLGPSEWALRLVPFLAACAALVLFWRLARRVTSPAAAALAVALLAVSRWPMHVSCQVKPYSLDLLASVGIMLLAVKYRQTRSLRALVLLALLTPIALGVSYPAVFVAGGVAAALLGVVVKRSDRPARWWFALLLLLLGGAFFSFDVVIAGRQMGFSGNHLHDFMDDYWQHGFPPREPAAAIRWLVWAHVGPLTGYPYGNGRVPGAITFALVVVGVWKSWRTTRRFLLALCLLPFVLTLSAAFLHKYPYGGCGRLHQHLAPAVCLLAAVGAVHLARLLCARPLLRWRVTTGLAALLGAFGIALAAYWHCHPYRDVADSWSKSVAREVMTHAAPGDGILYTTMPESVRCSMLWYLQIHGGKPAYFAAADRPAVTTSLWILSVTGDGVGPPAPTASTGRTERHLAHRADFQLPEPHYDQRRLAARLCQITTGRRERPGKPDDCPRLVFE